MRTAPHPRFSSTAGYSLVEMLVSMAIFTTIMGATLAGLANVTRGNETVLQIANMNNAVRTGMDAGLELVGNDVGTPIIAFTASDGVKRGIFGPVITRVPTGEQALRVWDAMEAFTTMDGFWELKRTRSEGPNVGDRPDV